MSVVSNRIQVSGLVQGVGFRPFIFTLAKRLGIKGTVQNTGKGVIIIVQCEEEIISDFIKRITLEKPPLCEVFKLQVKKITNEFIYQDFSILETTDLINDSCIVPADSSVCSECMDDLTSSDSRFYKYPFVNCTNCGPRMSIIERMPYDRMNTTMNDFPMCAECSKDYHDPYSRRYHAQPVSCINCGPQVWVEDAVGNVVANKIGAIEFLISKIKKGHIVALKSTGGFHLVCDAYNNKAVTELRKRKRRKFKSFAVMVADSDELSNISSFSDFELELISSDSRPMLLLDKVKSDLTEAISPGNSKVGVLFPSNPIHHLLFLDSSLKCLVFTSANSPGLPTCIDNEDVKNELSYLSDFFLLHNRKIHCRVDDSIVRTLKFSDKEVFQVIRNARGFSPLLLDPPFKMNSSLAVGSEMKNSITIANKEHMFLSSHIGDVSCEKSLDGHVDTIEKMSKLLGLKPDFIVRDSHPNFYYNQYHEDSGFPLYNVQHHHAHMCSCMLENGLISGNYLGIIFDGTGYSYDGTIWGGEFLYGNYNKVERVGSISSFEMPGGEKATREPLRTLASLVLLSDLTSGDLKGIPIFERNFSRFNYFKQMIERNINTVSSSSMGRLMDAFSCLILGKVDVEYEAQLVIELESLLNNDYSMSKPYDFMVNFNDGIRRIDFSKCLEGVISDIKSLKSKEYISRRFHSTVVIASIELTKILHSYYHFNGVVLSGGVFANSFLSINMYDMLQESGMYVYMNSKVPFNDGGISVGQLAAINYKLSTLRK